MPKRSLNNLEYSKDGVKYKHPERSCHSCSKYPCFDGIETKSCDFAKYGCIEYEHDTCKASS